jgi:hypothetical protein
MHPCCTYDGTDSKCQKNGSADRDHQFLLKAQMQRDAIVHDLASVVIYHPLGTLTEAEIEVRAVQSTGPRVLIWRRRSL